MRDVNVKDRRAEPVLSKNKRIERAHDDVSFVSCCSCKWHSYTIL